MSEDVCGSLSVYRLPMHFQCWMKVYLLSVLQFKVQSLSKMSVCLLFGLVCWQIFLVYPLRLGFLMWAILQKIKGLERQNGRPRFTVTFNFMNALTFSTPPLIAFLTLFFPLSDKARRTSTEEEKCPAGGESGGLWWWLRIQRSKCGYVGLGWARCLQHEHQVGSRGIGLVSTLVGTKKRLPNLPLLPPDPINNETLQH